MLEALQKSKQVSLFAMERLGDYLALLRIEMKLQGRELGVQLAGYLLVALSFFFVLLFTGIAIIVNFWDSDYRRLAAWVVVTLYLVMAAASIALVRRRTGRVSGMTTLREEIRRDVALIRESL